MKNSNMAISRDGHPYAQNQELDINCVRQNVISGDWSAINNRLFTLTDLGLRHNGTTLVWAKSGDPVREVDHEAGFKGTYAVSDDYHAKLDGQRPLETYVLVRCVHAHKIDDLCFGILHKSGAMIEYTHRIDGRRLSTHAFRIPAQGKQRAFDGYFIFRSPTDKHQYLVLHKDRDSAIVSDCLSRGWSSESAYELSLVVGTNAEFGLFMQRCGYAQIFTRKITGKFERLWVYRGNRKSKQYDDILPSVSQESSNDKAYSVVVQLSHKPRKSFKPVSLDGQNVYVYDDHVRFLTKKRHRVNGVRVQGYTAKGLTVEVMG